MELLIFIFRLLFPSLGYCGVLQDVAVACRLCWYPLCTLASVLQLGSVDNGDVAVFYACCFTFRGCRRGHLDDAMEVLCRLVYFSCLTSMWCRISSLWGTITVAILFFRVDWFFSFFGSSFVVFCDAWFFTGFIVLSGLGMSLVLTF